MDKLISLQDAIKAINEKAKRIKNEDTLNGLAGAVGILFDLPPVNPQPCEDAISRQAVQDYIAKYLSQYLYNDVREAVEVIDEYIGELPPVKPQEKTGHWIAQDIYNCHTNFKCSECGYIHSFMHLYGKPTADYTYCPNCGARMVNPQESEEV